MSKDEKRRQKSLARQAARRKQKKQGLVRQAAPSSHRATLRLAAHWPLYECLITKDWDQPGELTQILVSRSSPEGMVAAAGVLVDLACLGVKDALSDVFTASEYERFRRSYTGLRPMKKASLDLAAKIIREGIAYAGRLGFRPNRDYAAASVLLEGADPDACRTEIPLGMDGKPTFIAGPHDNVPKIMAQLERAVGPGNYHYLLGMGDMLASGDEDDAFEMEEDDLQELEQAEGEGDEEPRHFWSSLLHRGRH